MKRSVIAALCVAGALSGAACSSHDKKSEQDAARAAFADLMRAHDPDTTDDQIDYAIEQVCSTLSKAPTKETAQTLYEATVRTGANNGEAVLIIQSGVRAGCPKYANLVN